MPTPRPIMAATTGPEVPIVTHDASRWITPSPSPSPSSAVTSGTTMASSDPNATSSTTTAAARPKTSLPDGPDSAWTAGPPYSTWTPRSRTGSKAACASWTAPAGMSFARSVNCTVAMAVRPSSDTSRWPGPFGDRAAATPASSRTSATAASTARRTRGEVTPASLCTTTCIPSPDISGNRSRSVS